MPRTAPAVRVRGRAGGLRARSSTESTRAVVRDYLVRLRDWARRLRR